MSWKGMTKDEKGKLRAFLEGYRDGMDARITTQGKLLLALQESGDATAPMIRDDISALIEMWNRQGEISKIIRSLSQGGPA